MNILQLTAFWLALFWNSLTKIKDKNYDVYRNYDYCMEAIKHVDEKIILKWELFPIVFTAENIGIMKHVQ